MRDSDGRLTTYSDCWAGFGGMLLDDNITPQAKYWESLAYVNLPLDRLTVESSSKDVDAIAGRDDSVQQVQILVGRNSSTAFGAPPLPIDVSVEVNNYPYAAPNVTVRVDRIAKQFLKLADGEFTPVGVPQGPVTVSAYRDLVIDGTLTISVDGFGDGDVYRLTITPAG
jgi:hypothetical protein